MSLIIQSMMKRMENYKLRKMQVPIFKNGKKRQFYMRKWPKKYFLDALALHPDFKGEVELLDHMTNFDYFAFYEESKKALKLKLRK